MPKGMPIVVVGSTNTDMIIRTPRIPRPGETILGGDFFVAAGGKGANQAVAAARAGGQVTFVARVGRDVFGRQAIEGFRQDGINVEHITCDPEKPSGVALIFVSEGGANSIAVASGANSRLSPQDVERADHAIGAAKILVTQLEIPLETVESAVRLAGRHGVPVVLNPAPARPLSDALLRHVAVITPNETEAERLTGIPLENDDAIEEAADVLLGRGVQAVVITLGALGAFLATGRKRCRLSAFPVTAVDTTAAGDVFNGALAVALAEAPDLERAVRFATAAAAISVTRLGAQPSAPAREDILRLLTSRSSP
jgi:ribokinase